MHYASFHWMNVAFVRICLSFASRDVHSPFWHVHSLKPIFMLCFFAPDRALLVRLSCFDSFNLLMMAIFSPLSPRNVCGIAENQSPLAMMLRTIALHCLFNVRLCLVHDRLSIHSRNEWKSERRTTFSTATTSKQVARTSVGTTTTAATKHHAFSANVLRNGGRFCDENATSERRRDLLSLFLNLRAQPWTIPPPNRFVLFHSQPLPSYTGRARLWTVSYALYNILKPLFFKQNSFPICSIVYRLTFQILMLVN